MHMHVIVYDYEIHSMNGICSITLLRSVIATSTEWCPLKTKLHALAGIWIGRLHSIEVSVAIHRFSAAQMNFPASAGVHTST